MLSLLEQLVSSFIFIFMEQQVNVYIWSLHLYLKTASLLLYQDIIEAASLHLLSSQSPSILADQKTSHSLCTFIIRHWSKLSAYKYGDWWSARIHLNLEIIGAICLFIFRVYWNYRYQSSYMMDNLEKAIFHGHIFRLSEQFLSNNLRSLLEEPLFICIRWSEGVILCR